MLSHTRRSVVTAATSAVVLLGVCGLASGCSTSSMEQGAPSEVAGFVRTTSMPPEATMVDVTFLALMVPHHQQAVDMSNLVLSDPNASPEIRDLAERIRTQQSKEIDFMNSLAEEWDQEKLMRDHAGHLSMGMISQEQMDDLKSSTGAGKEDLYLRFMYVHHEGAMKSLANLVKNGGYEPLKEAAQVMIDTQTAEMAEMEQLLGEKPV